MRAYIVGVREDAVIRDIKTKRDPVFATEAAQAEFDCAPPPSRKPRE
jgi:hypothetical protein